MTLQRPVRFGAGVSVDIRPVREFCLPLLALNVSKDSVSVELVAHGRTQPTPDLLVLKCIEMLRRMNRLGIANSHHH